MITISRSDYLFANFAIKINRNLVYNPNITWVDYSNDKTISGRHTYTVTAISIKFDVAPFCSRVDS